MYKTPHVIQLPVALIASTLICLMDTVFERIQLNILLAGCLLASQIFPIYLQQVHGTVFSNECACSGDIIIYECTVVGVPEGVTVWRGTAIDCQSNEITLLHIRFASGTFGACNDGAIVARSLSVEGSNYTSQLNVTVTSDAAGKTIECFDDDASNNNIIIQFSAVIPTVITGPFPPPDRLYISTADFSSRKLTFDWSSVATECHKIQYNILASNCGSCPTTTNHTTVTCIDVPTNDSVCTFAIQTVVCENVTGNMSNPIRVNTSVLYPSDTLGKPSSAYIIYIISLATALIIFVVVSLTVVVILTRSNLKAKFNVTGGLDLTLTNKEGRSTNTMYEDVTGPRHSVSTITTQDNVAYHHTQSINTETTTETQ